MENLIIDNLEIDFDLKTCFVDKIEVPLSKNEFNLLEFLVNNKNKIHTREELLNEVWKSNVESRTVDMTISRLRKKLGDVSKHVISRFGFGYGFIA